MTIVRLEMTPRRLLPRTCARRQNTLEPRRTRCPVTKCMRAARRIWRGSIREERGGIARRALTSMWSSRDTLPRLARDMFSRFMSTGTSATAFACGKQKAEPGKIGEVRDHNGKVLLQGALK